MSVQAAGSLGVKDQTQDFAAFPGPSSESGRRYDIEAWQLGWTDDLSVAPEEFVNRVMDRIVELRERGFFQGYQLTDEVHDSKPKKPSHWHRFKHSVQKQFGKKKHATKQELTVKELAFSLAQGFEKNQLELICPWIGGYRPYGNGMEAWGFKVLPAITPEHAQEIMDEAWKSRNLDDIFFARYHQAHIPSINLPEAIDEGWSYPVLKLIERVRGAVNWSHSCGQERLLQAMEDGDTELVMDLLWWQVSPNSSKGRLNPLLFAIQHKPDYILPLLEQHADVNVQDKKGDTPLLLTLEHLPEFVEPMIEAGADVNQPGSAGEPPLMVALRQCPDAFERLLAAGGDPNLGNQDGITPLQLAVEKGDDSAVRLLLQAGADPSLPNRYPGQSQDWWAALVRAGAGEELLFSAVKDGNEELLQILIDQGVDVEMKVESQTILQLAVEGQNQQMVSLLLEAGADINVLAQDQKKKLLFPVIQMFAKEVGEERVPVLLEKFPAGLGLTMEAFNWIGYSSHEDGSYTFHYYSPCYPYPALSMDLGSKVAWKELPLVLQDLKSHQLFLNSSYLSAKFLKNAPKVGIPLGDVGAMDLVAKGRQLCWDLGEEISDVERQRVEAICGHLASNQALHFLSLAEHKRLRNFMKQILQKINTCSEKNERITALKMMAEMVKDDCEPHCGPGCRRYAQAIWEILQSKSMEEMQGGLLPKIDEIVQQQKAVALQDILIKGGGGSHSVNFFNYLVQSCEDAGIQFSGAVATQERDNLLNRAAEEVFGNPVEVVAEFQARLQDSSIFSIRDTLNERMRQQLVAARNGQAYREDRDFCCPVKKILLEHLVEQGLTDLENEQYEGLLKKHGVASFQVQVWLEDRLMEHRDLIHCEMDDDLGIETVMTLTLKGAAILGLKAGVLEAL